jgi:mannose-6-phosphate isomerase
MSFMFNPYDYDDTSAVNKPALDDETVNSVISGTKETAAFISNALISKSKSNSGDPVVVALDGYISAKWEQTINLISQNLKLKKKEVVVLNFSEIYKPSALLDAELSPYLEVDEEKDPVQLFGKIFDGSFENLLDSKRLASLRKEISDTKQTNENAIIIVYGCGSSIKSLRSLYDLICYFDVTPKEVMLRARNGTFANLGDLTAKPIKSLLRRCYYIDFEVAQSLRKDLIECDAIDFYILSTDRDNLKLIPRTSFHTILSALVTYPLRCKPVYLEGIWGGQFIKKLRGLPDKMKNCAWVFDLIPMEVSIVVAAGKNILEFPYFTFIQKEGKALMGSECLKKFGGYFPIRFNYDDSYHSSGNMSIQVHSGHDYNVKNFNELGRQDESYYIVATGHDAKTFIGFNEDADPEEFISEAKRSEKEGTPVDYAKYVNHIQSRPGVQVMLPAGTIHSSGRNQVVLEIGSLTIGSYTYKMYDYLRADLDGIPRPIHTWHGEKVVCKERKSKWVDENLVKKPVLVRNGEGWAEYIVGEHDLLYFSLRRLEFEKSIDENTNGKFHVLTLVDGEKVLVQSIEYPEHQYVQNYLDIITVPASFGKYKILNLGNQPVCIHKTMLKDGFINDRT